MWAKHDKMNKKLLSLLVIAPLLISCSGNKKAGFPRRVG
ncbi:uncharacterized protein EbC_36810 [Erwinia billingiae Eb661]|uniref:Lipoprotein n=1 Tax=Erwinia billingiae (strain Eb661) TaxID=634500 RepID=D8MWK5_ERWBE|nr:uncharacterized protein EbC_36810 [Erwinia billingiae Eb661]